MTTGKQNTPSVTTRSPTVPSHSGLASEIDAAQKGDTCDSFARSNGKLFMEHLCLVKGVACVTVQIVK